jgi:hypothetical protein
VHLSQNLELALQLSQFEIEQTTVEQTLLISEWVEEHLRQAPALSQ